jgi:MFS transporter, YNFM family, putative membrane transport protein
VSRPRRLPVAPVVPIVLAGFSAFLDLYATQPLLPFLARTFHASAFRVSLTVTAPAVAVAIAAPVAGRLGDRFGLRRMIVGSAFALAAATALAATAADLRQLIAWRFVQGLVTPGIFAVTIAYIHAEWPASHAGRTTAAYVSGTVVGGFCGRAITALLSADVGWSSAFLTLAAMNGLAAIALIVWLPAERQRPSSDDAMPGGLLHAYLRHPQLLTTYAIGFCVLCSQVAMFTYVTFLLAAPPFLLSTAALGWIFGVYLVGAVVTPFSGRWIDVRGHRVALTAAAGFSIGGALMTLAPMLSIVVAGLSVFATGVFIAQATAASHVGATAVRGRGLAIGLYSTCYYAGGSVGGALPALVWVRGGWPACVALIAGVQVVMVAIAYAFWINAHGDGALVPETGV